jgi:RES domain-containing protein
VKLWRIASTTRKWKADDLSGAGAAADPGRWNEHNQFVVYTASSLALAILETAAHIDDHGLPLNRFVVEIDVPAAIWKSRKRLDAEDLPAGWNAIPAGMVSVRKGSRWYFAGAHALLDVPSVIAPEERVVIINGKHPHAAQITAKTIRRFDYNSLFRR